MRIKFVCTKHSCTNGDWILDMLNFLCDVFDSTKVCLSLSYINFCLNISLT